MDLSRDFFEFIVCFAARDVKFLIVGGYAMAAHGHPRYTKDLDVWVWIDPQNASNVVAALDDFGFGDLGLSEKDFADADMVVQLGREPQRIDILTSAARLEFPTSYARRETVRINGLDVPFLSIADLRTNKKATGRLRDLADLEDLPEAHS